MLTITQKQMDMLDADCFRRNAIKFVEGELRLFDDAAEPPDVAAGFDQLSQLLDTKTRHGRLTTVLLLLASRAFSDTFTEAAITRLMALSCTPENVRSSFMMRCANMGMTPISCGGKRGFDHGQLQFSHASYVIQCVGYYL